jgi:hypothetical protein
MFKKLFRTPVTTRDPTGRAAKLSAAVALTFAALAFAGLSWAANPNYANVIANAECTVDGDDVLVEAFLEQKEKLGPGPQVGVVTFTLEQHIRNVPQFQMVFGSDIDEPVSHTFAEMPAGESVSVATHDYEDICTTFLIDPNANAIRAVVEVEVLNSNPNRGKEGVIHTGRCISFPNPCR